MECTKEEKQQILKKKAKLNLSCPLKIKCDEQTPADQVKRFKVVQIIQTLPGNVQCVY